ncbi:hypothetical protein, partial [Dactylosporangium sp. NPDC050588]|uniref:hypothetical protein n=1 Tax=Dactylosporangium sp. NPDC050588 TaxID=3157211 RepID=UPI0033F7CE0A
IALPLLRFTKTYDAAVSTVAANADGNADTTTAPVIARPTTLRTDHNRRRPRHRDREGGR